MGRKPKNADPKISEDGEQLDLIETEPESAKALARLARAFNKAKCAEEEARAVVAKKREALLAAVREASERKEIEHDEYNPYTFTANKVKITVTPMAERIKVREVGKDEEENLSGDEE